MQHFDYWRAHVVWSDVLCSGLYGVGRAQLVREAGRLIGLARDCQALASRWEYSAAFGGVQDWGSTRDIVAANRVLVQALSAYRSVESAPTYAGHALIDACLLVARVCSCWWDTVGVCNG